MKFINQFDDVIEVTDKITAHLNDCKDEYNYEYFLSLRDAKFWVRKKRKVKCEWKEEKWYSFFSD